MCVNFGHGMLIETHGAHGAQLAAAITMRLLKQPILWCQPHSEALNQIINNSCIY